VSKTLLRGFCLTIYTVLCKSNASQFRRISWLFPAFRRNFAHREIAAINRRNFVTPIVSFRAKVRARIRDARSFEANFWAIIRHARNFGWIFRANFCFVCQFSSISGQCFAAFEIRLNINLHLRGAVVRVKSSCDPSAYAVSRLTEPILGNCCVKLTWLFSKESPTVYYILESKSVVALICSLFKTSDTCQRASEWYLFSKH